jgi:hypothetical protein
MMMKIERVALKSHPPISKLEIPTTYSLRIEKIKETIYSEKNDLEKSSAHHSASLHLTELCQHRKQGTVEYERSSPRNYLYPMSEAGLGNSQT